MDTWEITIPLDHPGVLWPDHREPFPLHLDALLTALVAGPSEQRGSGGDTLPPIPLPLAQTAGVYHASAAVALRPVAIERVALSTRHRTDWNTAVRMGTGTKGLPSQYAANTGNWTERLPTGLVMQTPGLRFWAMGDGDALHRILQRLRYLGAWRGRGFGRVRPGRIVLRRVARDYSWWLPNGRPARVLPVRVLDTVDPSWAQGWARGQPPYWARSDREWCVWPDPALFLPEAETAAVPSWLTAAAWVGQDPAEEGGSA